MINNDLLNYIRIQQAQGFSYNEIESFLQKNGYKDEIIKEHFAQLMPKHKPIQPLLIVIGVVALLIVGGGIVFASWFFSQPVCGNGVLEEGENPSTCCIDAGCFGDESCVNNICELPALGECQYLVGSEVFDYECCSDDECSSGFSCQNNQCREVICGFCQYVDGNSCSSYECCEDSMCASGESCVDRNCVPSSEPIEEVEEIEISESVARSDCGVFVFGDSNEEVLDCFIDSARLCESKSVTIQSSVDIFGVISETTQYYEILGEQDGLCLQRRTYLDSTARLSQELIDMALEEGTSQVDIDAQEQEFAAEEERLIGKYVLCKYPVNDLVSELEEWKTGNFTSVDLEEYECAGSLLDPDGEFFLADGITTS